MHRTSKRGTYRLDRRFPGVGRIAVASGTRTAAEFAKRNALLTRLYDQGRLDLLQAIQAGTLSVTQVYAADRARKLDTLTGERAALGRPLWPAVRAWLATRPGLTGRRYAVSFAALERTGVLGASAPVEALVRVDWPALRASWAPSPASWNHLRRALSAFLTAQLADVHHPFRRQVLKRYGKPECEVARVPDLSPELFWRIVRAAPPHAQPAFVALLATGLRVGEYLRLQETDLHPHTCSVRVPGTKTAASAATVRVSEQLWPWVAAAVPSPLAYKWLRLTWRRACRAVGATDLRLHDLRHAHGQWSVNAGVPEAAVQASLRHTSGAMTRRYTMQKDRGTVADALAGVLLGSAGPQLVPLSENGRDVRSA